MVIMRRSQDKLQKVALKTNCRKWPTRSVSWLSAAASLYPSPPPPLFPPLFSSLQHTPLTLLTLPSLTPHHSTPLPEEKYNREVRIIPVDFSEGHEIYPRIADELQDLDIGVLSKACNSFFKPLSLLCSWTHSPHVACVHSKQCRLYP